MPLEEADRSKPRSRAERFEPRSELRPMPALNCRFVAAAWRNCLEIGTGFGDHPQKTRCLMPQHHGGGLKGLLKDKILLPRQPPRALQHPETDRGGGKPLGPSLPGPDQDHKLRGFVIFDR